MGDYLIYDCEIIKMIPPKDGIRLDGYEYCEGWHSHETMGVSVVGIYASWHDKYWYWSSDSPYSLESFFPPERALDPGCHIIGFNSKNFDDRLMAANGVQIQTTYDLLEEIRFVAFGSPRWQDTPKGRSYSLGALGEANGFPKTGTGELAPKLWQDGKRQEVVSYCLNDVRVTHELLKLGLEGKLIDPNTEKLLRLMPIGRNND